MYTDKEFIEAGSSLKRFILLFCLFAALLLAAAAYALVFRVEWLLYASAGLLAVGGTFLWGNYGVRFLVWNRFLTDMKSGLERSVEGVIASVDEQETTKDGLEFRAVRLLTGEESDVAGGRLLYADVSRFPLPAGPEQKVACRLFGNYIKDMEILEDR